MSLTSAQKKKLIAETKDAAGAFIGDLQHLRTIIHKGELKEVEIRHLSNMLRRWLVEEGLKEIANPRIGKFHLVTANNQSIIPKSDKEIILYVNGSPLIKPNGFLMDLKRVNSEKGILGIDPWRETPLPLKKVPMEGFRKERVLCFRDTWATRDDVIKYVANVASGVHSGKVRSETQEMLHKIRYAIESVRADKQIEQYKLNMEVIGNPIEDPGDKLATYKYDPDTLDLTLSEVIAAGYFIVQSEDIMTLDKIIREELHN